MNVAQHAERILAAWNVADPVSFEQELENALSSCRGETPLDHLEYEQQEVLESVIERLRADAALSASARGFRRRDKEKRELPSSQGLNAGFALLEHLSQRAAA
jgi:hypothetical protein